jgi:hypothetical protein
MEICHFYSVLFFHVKQNFDDEKYMENFQSNFFVEFLGIEKLETFRLLSGEFCFFNILGSE